MKPPHPEQRVEETHLHGFSRVDEFAWLRADNWQEVMTDPETLDPRIRRYLQDENAYLDHCMADTSDLQTVLFEEMKGRIKEDDSSVPAPDGAYQYATRYVEGGQHPVLVRQKRGGGDETVLLDGDALADGKAYFRLGGAVHTPDHRRLAWSSDEMGSEYFTLRVRDVAGGTDLPEAITNTTGSAVWDAAGETIFYVLQDENHRPSRVYSHRLGTETADDQLIYEEPDSGIFVGIAKTQSGRFIVIDCHDHDSSEQRIVPSDRPTEPPQLIAERKPEIEYSIDDNGSKFFILTNAAGAEDFQIMVAPIDDPGPENWQKLIQPRDGCMILSHCLFARHMVRLERQAGLPRIVIRELASNTEHAIEFSESVYSLGFTAGYEFDTDELRITYSSLTTPAQVYDYDMIGRARVLRKQQEVPSGHDPDAYVTERLMAPAPDGETVPISVLRAKATPLDGTAPCLLYGYGSYGIAMPAAFSTAILSLVDRGFVYAIAHVRGGKEKGMRWYKSGRRGQKTNTFTDFIAAAEHLAATDNVSSDRIVAEGGSAGGMLMGAIANMRPDLFAGIVAQVPFVDVLATMLDDTLPLTPPEWPEWGNPIESAEDYQTIAAYSPYDNVSAQDYPAILALGGLTDPRVTYWEPAKWVARLRARRTNDALLLLKTNMEAGHGGAAGRFDRLKEVALSYAFALKTAAPETIATEL